MKKSLSILLALLMILSSMPIMAFTASAEQADPNVMADYTYANWQTRRWGSSNEGTESLNGGTSIYIRQVNYQTAFTTVTLEPNTTYSFNFNWMADANENLNGIYPCNIYVYAESDYGSNEALLAPAPSADLGNYVGSGSWHHDEGKFYPAGATGMLKEVATDLETATADATARKNATAGTWQNVSTKFTTNSTDTNYAIMIEFAPNSTGAAGLNAIHFSDFSLVNPSAVSLATPIEQKPAEQWVPFQHSKIYADTSKVQDDGTTSLFRVEMPAYQTVATSVTLTPNTKYNFTFDYYSETHANGIAGAPTIEGIFIYPYASGDVFNSDSWLAEHGYVNAAGCADLESGGNYGSGADTWVTAQTGFTTTEETRYNILIKFNITGEKHATDQKIYLADFSIEEFLAPKPGNILNNATYVNGDVSWSKTINTGDSGDLEAQMSFAAGLDNPEFSINGGYAWAFNFGYNTINGVYGYVYIKANGLKADATYDLSYICVNDFRFKIDSIKNDTAVAEYIVAPAYATVDGYDAEKTAAMFTVPEDGDYVITLISNKDSEYRMAACNWTGSTYLCDLELYERGALYNVAVSKEGYGVVKADKTGLTEEGTDVTFTAKADLYERFLGWYVGDELVSEELTYTATVEGDLNPVAKFTTNSENLMADYSVANGNFGSKCWGTVSDSSFSRYGGNGVYVLNCPNQTFFTKVTLKANTDYKFSFEWKAQEHQSGALFPNKIQVLSSKAGDPFDASMWNDSKWPQYQGDTTTYPDLENGSGYSNQDVANTYTWQNISTSFTTTEDTEYIILIDVSSTTVGNGQSIYYSDFVLKTEPVIEYTGTKYDWNGVHWSEVSDSADSKDGGYAYKVAKAMSQNINTTLTLKPGTTYNYSFNWKAIDNAKGLAFVQSSSIYSANSGDPTKGNKTNYSWYDETDSAGYTPIYIPNEGYSNLMANVSNPNGTADAADDVLKGWNTYSATFTTIEDEDYYLFINFGLKGSNGNQTVIISDVVIEETVIGSAPEGDEFMEYEGYSLRKETESNYGQAIRNKFTVSAEVIASAYDGYELVEYGAVVALAKDATDPILDATSYTVRKGVAYQKAYGADAPTTDIYWAKDDNGVTFSAALYNIPTEQYSADIAIRAYAVFENAQGDRYVRYGSTTYASVFAVAKAILDDADAVQSDLDYVNNTLLAGDIKTAYNAWATEQ